ncbi:phage tail tape measure protein [Sulfurihydrogenibium sp.]|uniref:phage tail tape measure protein n=1 Tax=Sulfurihydrogenibium sp. TaxID=2053621 RepID=UPI00261414A6|nr:phage tail tape measure protein [Sulfurihydrogenibium sp.]
MDFKIAIALQLVDNFTKQLFEVRENLTKFSQDIEKTQRGLTKLGETFKKAFDPKTLWETSEKFENFSSQIAQATALPLAGITQTLRAFSEMESARTEMEVAFMTRTGLPEEISKINKIVDELGTKLPGTTADFYRVATALKSAGMSAKDIAEGVLKGASYSWVLFKREVSPEQAAEYMQEFANAFKIPANQFMDFVDQLQRVKFASGLTLTEIAYSTKYFSAEINQLGITGINAFKLMGAWIGTLSQLGLKGETAGTSIRSVLQNIINLDENVAKLSKQGIDLQISTKDFLDENGAFKLEQFLITIRDKLSAINDPLQRMQVLKTLFDGEGMRAIAPLLGKTKEEALEYLKAIKDSFSPEEYEMMKKQIEFGGFSGLEEMAKAMHEQASLQDRINKTLNTFSNIWESLQGTMTSLAAIIGELVAPSMKLLMDTVNNFIGKIADFISKHQTLSKVLTYTVGGFVGFLAVLGAVGIVVASMMKLFAFAFAPFIWFMRIALVKGLTTAIFQNALAFMKWAITGTTSTGWLKTLDFLLLRAKLSMLQLVGVIKLKTIALRAMALAWITSPIGLIIAGISTLIAIGYLLYRNWDKVIKALVWLWNWLKTTLSSVWNWLKTNWQKVLQVFLMINPLTAPIIALQKLIQFVSGINLFQAGQKIVNSLWEGIKSIANKPVQIFKEITQKIRNLLPFSPAKEGPLKDINRIKLIETIAENIKPAPLVNQFSNVLSQATSIRPLVQPVKQVLEPVKAFTQPLIQPVKQVLEPVIKASTSSTNIVINLGGVHITGKMTTDEAKVVAQDIEREIRKVLDKIQNERMRRAY